MSGGVFWHLLWSVGMSCSREMSGGCLWDVWGCLGGVWGIYGGVWGYPSGFHGNQRRFVRDILLVTVAFDHPVCEVSHDCKLYIFLLTFILDNDR